MAGLLGGAAVVVLFFVYDLLALSPLATPASLSAVVLGPAGRPIDLFVLGEIVHVVTFAIRLATFTLLHFLVFGGLGMGAAFLYAWSGAPRNAWTGALYGLAVCSLVFYLSPAGVGSEVLVPTLPAVLSANLVAGAVMGAYLKTTLRP